jgi:hypothetical protein
MLKNLRFMSTENESTKVTLDLSKELTGEELQSFRARAKAEGHSLSEHLRKMLFGDERKESAV